MMLLLALPAQSQRPRNPDRGVRPAPSQEDSTALAQYRHARALINAGNLDSAIDVLDNLLAAYPANITYHTTLREAYEAHKRYDDAINLIDRTLATIPQGNAVQLKAEKARILHTSGKEQQAFSTWNQILDASGNQERYYRTVYESMLKVRLIDRAISVLERGRADTGRPELYQTELAYLHGLAGAYDRAMEEYLDLLSINFRQVNYVRGRLTQMLQQEGALAASLPIAKERVEQVTDNPAFREIYAWLLTENGNYAEAFEEYRLLSGGQPHAGRVFFDFAAKAADLGEFDIAAEAYNEVLDNHPDAPLAAEAQLGLANMHRQHAEQLDVPSSARPYYEAAEQAYRTFLANFPGHASYPAVLRRIADLQQHVFLQPEEAERTLFEVVRRYPNTASARQAHFDLGRLAINQDRLDEARIIFLRLEEMLRHRGALADHARYERALINYYQGELAAATTLASTIKQNTTTDTANDVLAFRVLILENPGPDSANVSLQQYARAQLRLRQRRFDEVITTADSLLGGPGGQHPIADEARFLRAQALRASLRTEEALLAFGEIPLIYPESPLADQSLFLHASILDQDMGKTEEAIEAYSRLLTQMRGSLLAPEARSRIRALQNGGI